MLFSGGMEREHWLKWVHFSILVRSNVTKLFEKKEYVNKKSHTCEEGGAHLRISFWHLLMNFEKPEKLEF